MKFGLTTSAKYVIITLVNRVKVAAAIESIKHRGMVIPESIFKIAREKPSHIKFGRC